MRAICLLFAMVVGGDLVAAGLSARQLTRARMLAEKERIISNFFTSPQVVVKLEDGTGVSSADLIRTMGVSEVDGRFLGKTLSKLKDTLGIELVTVLGSRRKVWVREGIEAKPEYRYNFNDLQGFFSEPRVIDRLTDGTGVSSAEVADFFDENRVTMGRSISRFADRLGIKLVRRPREAGKFWLAKDVEPNPAYKYKFSDLKEFFGKPEIVAKLEDDFGVMSAEVAEFFNEDNRVMGREISRFANRLGIVKYGKPWVSRKILLEKKERVISEIFSRPQIVAKLEDGTGVSSADLVKIMGNPEVDGRLVSIILSKLKGRLEIESVKVLGSQRRVWVREGIKAKSEYRYNFNDLQGFFSKPQVIDRLTDGTGISSAEVAGFWGEDRVTMGVSIARFADQLGIELVRRPREARKIWLAKGVEPRPIIKKLKKEFKAKREPIETLSELQNEIAELFAKPEVLAKLEDGTGIMPVEVAEALNFDNVILVTRNTSVIKEKLNVELTIRLGDRKHLWVRKGIELKPTYKYSLSDLEKFFNKPAIVAKLENDLGVMSAEVAEFFNENNSVMGHAISRFADQLGIKLVKKSRKLRKTWVRKETRSTL